MQFGDKSDRLDAPRVFVSYAWEGDEHKEWVKELAVRLRLDGVELLLDQWELAPGDELSEFMERAIRESDAVLIVCTPSYKTKSERRVGGVGYEGSIITAEILGGAARRRFIPLLRRGEWADAAPQFVRGSLFIDFRGHASDLEGPYRELLKTLHRRRDAPPPVGSPPFPVHSVPEPVSISGELPHHEPPDSPNAYPFVLTKLLETDVPDEETRQLALDWLMSHRDADSWAFVWQALAVRSQDGQQVWELGRRWLAESSPDSTAWPHVWNALMDAFPDDPVLQERGRQWLRER